MELVSTTIAEQRPLKHSGEPFPTVLRPMDPQNATAASLVSWCQRNHGKLRNQAMCSGAVLLRGFNVSGSEDFAAVTRALGCEDYDYIGGAAPRTELVPGVVFTANEAPPDSIIPFHHELAQAPNPPQYIFFIASGQQQRVALHQLSLRPKWPLSLNARSQSLHARLKLLGCATCV